MKLKLLILSIALLVVGCSDSQNPSQTSQPDFDSLTKAPTNLQIDSLNFSLEVYLWRDYMPIAPEDGKPMSAVINLRCIDSMLIPQNIDIDKLWVLDSVNIWETEVVDNFTVDSLYEISKRAGNGPKWETGRYLDAVIRIVENDSVYHYLKSEHILLEKTE